MIKIDVADYCHNCPYFEANVTTDISSDPWEQVIAETTITCTEKAKCFNIYNHIERQMKNNDKT